MQLWWLKSLWQKEEMTSIYFRSLLHQLSDALEKLYRELELEISGLRRGSGYLTCFALPNTFLEICFANAELAFILCYWWFKNSVNAWSNDDLRPVKTIYIASQTLVGNTFTSRYFICHQSKKTNEDKWCLRLQLTILYTILNASILHIMKRKMRETPLSRIKVTLSLWVAKFRTTSPRAYRLNNYKRLH